MYALRVNNNIGAQKITVEKLLFSIHRAYNILYNVYMIVKIIIKRINIFRI